MDDIIKKTTIKTKGKLTKSDLNDFWMWVCIKAERMGFELENRTKEEKPDPKSEYIEKITG